MAKNLIIDDLPLDYSILYEVAYEYPTRSAFFTFMTKGCTRKCSFCSVPILEPTYKPKIETFDKFSEIKHRFGDQQNLLLMDNNVLVSPKFIEIIDEIKSMGFHKGATFIEPNQLDIAIKNLKEGYNDVGFVRRTYWLLFHFMTRLKGTHADDFYKVLNDYQIHKYETTTKENLIAAYPHLAALYERYRNKSPKLRYVDFNQGTDARYVTEEIMEKMAEIPIRPLRIAFDYIGLKKQYVNAVRLAAKYGIKELSNYILYNFQDKPEDLYERLRINADLCKELNVAIFSFPMKYIPLFGEEAKHREFTGKHWSKKFVRAIQSVLNVTKGIVAPSNRNEKTSFFEEAFGKDLNEFFEILYMPETYIIYRHLFRYDFKYTTIWETEYRNLSEFDRKCAQNIIQKNIFTPEVVENPELSDVVKHFLRHYTIYRGSIEKEDGQYRKFRTKFDGLIKNEPFTDVLTTEALPKEDVHYKKLKTKFDTLIKEDPFIDLTLTYDFENEVSLQD